MFRVCIASVTGFILVFIESFIVMKLKDYHAIDFGGIKPFVGVWAMNFFLVFSILTQIKQWYEEKEIQEEEAAK